MLVLIRAISPLAVVFEFLVKGLFRFLHLIQVIHFILKQQVLMLVGESERLVHLVALDDVGILLLHVGVWWLLKLVSEGRLVLSVHMIRI